MYRFSGGIHMHTLAHRKATARLQLLKPDGSPCAQQPVEVNQVSHKFLFGCGVFDALNLFQEQPQEALAFQKDRMDKWLHLFNYGTLPFYWGRYEPVEGQTAQEQTLKAARWLQSQGVTLKGHPLCWHTACADWLMNYSNQDILTHQLDRIHRDVHAFQGVIDMWDVINEVVIMPVFDRYDNAITRICREFGRFGLVQAVFQAAHETNPNAVLLINDFNTSPAYEILIEGLLDKGVPISAIGVQSHQHQGYWGAAKLEEVLERFSRFGLPIHFTENTLVSGEIMPPHIVDLNDFQVDSWPSTEEGELRQAAEITEMYQILFSHPLVQAITTWDFTDGKWLHAPSGFLHADNTLKPSYRAMEQLIHHDWETHLTCQTDADGCLTFEGFRGTYTLCSGKSQACLALDTDTKTCLQLV